ncbi:MAG: hypothetical protein REI64_14840 [Pedobacter sp.]|uniref:hypothetical protein n=1 Tax=Pedobacter sp. TaxID=1411316 RepID=UPI002808C6A5|nr:hypothetical protein [Pedobacter sp.]MDQ8006076.1 hypothetical protein [Pedobacter sp.]
MAQNVIDTAEAKLITEFNNRMSPQIRLYNGPSYIGFGGKLIGNPYLGDKIEFVKGEVDYDGFHFSDVPLMYDMAQEILVSILPKGYAEFSLITSRVASFKLQNKKFVNLKLRNDSGEPVNLGFYEQTYSGTIQVLVKQKKQVKEIIDTYGARKEFPLKTEYFVLTKEGQLHKISRESSFTKLFPSNKSELRKYAKQNNLNFKKDPVSTLNNLSKFYDSLSN